VRGVRKPPQSPLRKGKIKNMEYPIDKNYYTRRKDELLKQFEEKLRQLSPFVFGPYGEINAYRIIQQTRKEFEELIQKKGAGMDLPALVRQAFYRAMEKQGKTAAEADLIMANASTVKPKKAVKNKGKTAPKKAITAFAGYLTSTRYEDLPAAAVAAVKQEILDSLATALGGSVKAGVPELVDMVKEWGGAKQSTVIGYGLKVPAPNAAQVNGTMIHALDYDDGHQVALVHIGCTAVSTAFASAERMGNVNGKELITALALGADFESRMSLASKPGGSIISTGWHPTALFGFLSTAAIAGRIFGLNEDKMINALGLAYHQAGGAGSGVPDGALAKRMGPGLAAKVGITSALMAERGITGDRDPLEGKTGLYKMYMGGDYNPRVLTKELGKRWEGVNIGDKPYPCCGFTHAAVDGILSLRTKHKINPENIKEITVIASQSTYDLSQPPEVKRHPRTIIDAQFSVPYVAAVALLYGAVTVDDFTFETIKRPAVLKMAQKVNTILNTNMNRHGVGPSTVTIMMKDGKSYTEHVEFCLGSVERPMTLDHIARKFRECAKSSVKPLKKDAVEKIIDMVGRLETLDDAAEIIRLVG
jgi:2-methylcitrate dehydratase PrpD